MLPWLYGSQHSSQASSRPSHANNLRGVFSSFSPCSTLEPALCARKETNDKNLSTTERTKRQPLAMRSVTSVRQASSSRVSVTSSGSIPTRRASLSPPLSLALPPDFRSGANSQSNPKQRRTMALQRTAPGLLRVSRWLLPADPPRSQRATLRSPSAVSELESLAFIGACLPLRMKFFRTPF